MKLWKISQSINNNYDTYSNAVVASETEEEARNTHPSGDMYDAEYVKKWGDDSWCDFKHVKVEFIGTAKEGTKAGVICALFHAG